MPLTIGARLGPYEVVAPLGAGGMGEVYRARDARLHREVALKVLPEHLAADAERLARLEREAQALAALKHPHIAMIYGVYDEPGATGGRVRALVLELVEGDTLAERIARGPIPVDEAIELARKIADALEAAHEQGIIHRDLKPANIKITPDGGVKILDFGLAKLQTGIEGRDSSSASMSPTMTSPAVVTGVSVLLGTAGYMAPEQARGRTVDRRADIWAFGVVLYEMLSGRPAFEGESVTDVIAGIIHKDLDWNALPPGTPSTVRAVLGQCLQKDPKQRIRDIGDVRLLLDGALALPEPAAAIGHTGPTVGRRLIEIGAASIVAALAAGAAVWFFARTDPPSHHPVRFQIPTPVPEGFSLGAGISPDGRTVGFLEVVADGARLWLHGLDSSQSRPLPGVDFKQRAGPSFWSPDSRSLGMWIDGKIKRVDVSGGPAEALADVPKNFGGGTWSRDNVILYSDIGGILRIPASGGTPVKVTSLDASRQENAHFLPSFLPDGRHFLYVRLSNDPGVNGVYIGRADASPEQQDLTRLVATGSQAIYSPDDGSDRGHLLFLRDGLLIAQPFNARTRTLSGDAVPVLDEPVLVQNGFAMFSTSDNGTLVYRAATSPLGTMVATNRSGQRETLLSGAKLDRAANPRLSPDGRHLALILAGELWSYDLGGRPPIKLTFDGNKFSPLWTPDGTRIVYEQGGSKGRVSLFAIRADGSAGAAEPVAPEGHYHPHGWTAGGDLVAARLDSGTVSLFRFPPRPDAKPETVQDTPATEGLSAAVSPDGRWLAYAADTTGRGEIWVRSVQGPGAAVRVSPNGGSEPVWARNGRELYYLEGDKMMAVGVELGASFNFKPPVELFRASIARGTQPPSYDVTPDGRFIFVMPDQTGDVPISVVLNWTELVRNRVSAQ